MGYEEMIKEAFQFGRLGLGRRIGRALGRGVKPQTIGRTQTPAGRMFDKMMAEFVAANPKAVQQAYQGQSGQVARAFKKHQAQFFKRHGVAEKGMRTRLPKSEAVLSAQVKRHSRRQVGGRTPVPQVPKAAYPGRKVIAGGALGLAGGVGAAQIGQGDQSVQRPAGYAGGGAYGY